MTVPAIPPRRPFQGLRLVCGAFAACVAACTVLTWFLVEGFQFRPFGTRIPGTLPASLALFSTMLLLLASRFRTAILRNALRVGPTQRLDLEAFAAAYRRATLVSFAVLEVAALLGLLVALLSGSSFYGVVLCVASFLSMLIRWPKEHEAARLASGRVSP
jgi:hypothetical protein